MMQRRGNFGNNKVPDRWEVYTNMGRQIPGTRFIAFKVPLREGILRNVKDALLFSPRTLMEHCTNLGLVIDLTNTSRYYDPMVFKDQRILYAKVFTEGKVVPSKGVVTQFFNIVNSFLKKNKHNDRLIGVHCTHGINRTGYMICRFMIQQLGIPPDQAIADFNSARGHEQERENYLADLRQAPWIRDVVRTADDYFDDNRDRRANTAFKPGSSAHSWRSHPIGESPKSAHTWRSPPIGESPKSAHTWRSPLGKSPNGKAENTFPEWSPWSKGPVRRWSTSPRNSERHSEWGPWRGSSPKEYHTSGKHEVGHSPLGLRRYYDRSYQGRMVPQYDPYFYQQRASGVGPHRPPPRWAKNQYAQAGPQGRPRQYRGPRMYRSPRANEEAAAAPQCEEDPRTPLAARSYPDLPTTPYWSPEGPGRNPLSPGAKDNVFSPITPRRRSSRWNPY
ncbi:uncharacterized protein [Panulirus ornatus]|uniref:uncharacterized protein isoform X1 n=1 Tax=Panulirus ornatus TaxID=150431 RepID=UPI003A8918AB